MYTTPFALLKFVAKAMLNAGGGGVLGDFCIEVLPELFKDIWDSWSDEKNEQERREELEILAHAAAAEVRQDVVAIVNDLASERSEKDRQVLETILMQVPERVRQSLRRPSDPTGTTIPADLVLRKAEDLLPFLPDRMPRFKPGDRPLAGLDWELAELLGIGGFGEVWKARHTYLESRSPVALKFCLDPQARQRLLLHEAKVCDRVMRQGRHPGIVQLQETYLSADPPCLQYEYVEGGDLAGLIREWHRQAEKPTPDQFAKAILKISEIVAFAHRLTPPIVHRDIKPANILVQRSDGAAVFKIADFGIGGVATFQAIRATRQGTSASQFMTSAVRGSYTPSYASPEQMQGNPPDPRDDVHALGVIWYQMLTGDLTKGRPGGSGWRNRFIAQGMTTEMVALLESCFEDQDERPADAFVFLEKLKSLLKTGHTQGGSVSGKRVEELGRLEGHTDQVLAGNLSSNYVQSQKTPDAPAKSSGSRGRVGELRRIEEERPLICLAFSPDGRRALLPGMGLELWDVEAGKMIHSFEPNGFLQIHNRAEFSHDGTLAISGDNCGTVFLWDMKSYKAVRSFEAHTGEVGGVTISHDGRRALTSGCRRSMTKVGDESVRLWDVETGEMLQCIEGHSGEVASFAFSPDSLRIITGGRDGSARLWDARSGKELRRFGRTVHCVDPVAFSSNGRLALTRFIERNEGSSECSGVIRVWDVESGKELRHFALGRWGPGQERNIVGATAFSHDGSRAISGRWDGAVQLWDMNTGEELQRLDGHTGRISRVAFSLDGLRALSSSDDKTVRLWGLPDFDQQHGKDCQPLTAAAGERVNAYTESEEDRTLPQLSEKLCEISRTAWSFLDTANHSLTLLGNRDVVSNIRPIIDLCSGQITNLTIGEGVTTASSPVQDWRDRDLEHLHYFRSLKRLDFQGCKSLTGDCLRYIAQLESLQELDLSMWFPKQIAAEDFKVLARLRNARRIKINAYVAMQSAPKDQSVRSALRREAELVLEYLKRSLPDTIIES